jgi:hypothetical protein
MAPRSLRRRSTCWPWPGSLELSANSIRIRKRSVAVTTDLVTPVNIDPLVVGNWYTLGLKVEGSTLTAYFNGAPVASGTDPISPINSGGVALATSSAGATFDDVRVTVP